MPDLKQLANKLRSSFANWLSSFVSATINPIIVPFNVAAREKNLGLEVISWYQVSGYSIGNQSRQRILTWSISWGLRNLGEVKSWIGFLNRFYKLVLPQLQFHAIDQGHTGPRVDLVPLLVGPDHDQVLHEYWVFRCTGIVLADTVQLYSAHSAPNCKVLLCYPVSR